jgi:hypothetical protein
MKRMVLLLTVTALMMVMLAMSVTPAFAKSDDRYRACFATYFHEHIPAFCIE